MKNKLKEGDKIKLDLEDGKIEYAKVLEHMDTDSSDSVYLVKWSDGSRTLFEVKEENLIDPPKRKKKKWKRKTKAPRQTK